MVVLFWCLFFLSIGLGIWGFSQYQRQNQRLRKLKQSLLEANQRLHEKEEKHAQNESQGEKTEEKLRRYLQLMDTLINTIPNPIYFKDADAIYQGCNKVFAKQILGLTRDRIIGRRPQELPDQIPADLAAVYQREELKMIEKAGFHTFEAQVQCADGQRREFLFNLSPIRDDDNRPGGCVAVLFDLTEKNRAAQDRLQKEKLQGVLETAGAVCHEFNQPLQALSGYIEILKAKGIDDPKLQASMIKVEAQIERMADITAKLQNITRYETTDYAGNKKIIDLHKASEI
jgi:PAS domain S-box-containing protein